MTETIIVSTPATKIYTRKGVVYIQAPDQKPIPVTADTEQVILATGAVTVTGRALRRLAELGVRLIVLGAHRHTAAELRPVDRVNKTIEARIAQLEAKIHGWGLQCAAKMVEAKLHNQARLLRRLAKNRREPWLREESYKIEDQAHQLAQLAENPQSLTPETVRALEAKAARTYWQAIAALTPQDLGFTGRNPEADDPLNKALNYAYAILYTTTIDALTLAGLDPYAGLLHSDRSGKPSLVYDYSDTYKPIAVDHPLITNPKPELYETSHGTLTYLARREIARRVIETLNTPIQDQHGTRRRLQDHITAHAWNLAKTLRQRNCRNYQAFIARL